MLFFFWVFLSASKSCPLNAACEWKKLLTFKFSPGEWGLISLTLTLILQFHTFFFASSWASPCYIWHACFIFIRAFIVWETWWAREREVAGWKGCLPKGSSHRRWQDLPCPKQCRFCPPRRCPPPDDAGFCWHWSLQWDHSLYNCYRKATFTYGGKKQDWKVEGINQKYPPLPHHRDETRA